MHRRTVFILAKPVAKLLTQLVLAGLLTACNRTQNFVDLQEFVDSVKARPGAQIEPVPVFASYEAFTYGAASSRSPFDVPFVVPVLDGVAAKNDVQPDPDRIREPLEGQSLGELAMVGMLLREGNYIALIRDNQNKVHRVSIGHHLGRNHGRVFSITATQTDLIEIVPSGDGRWVERPQSLVLQR